jgi:hypothetical protein
MMEGPGSPIAPGLSPIKEGDTSLEIQIKEARRRAEEFSRSLQDARRMDSESLQELKRESEKWRQEFDAKWNSPQPSTDLRNETEQIDATTFDNVADIVDDIDRLAGPTNKDGHTKRRQQTEKMMEYAESKLVNSAERVSILTFQNQQLHEELARANARIQDLETETDSLKQGFEDLTSDKHLLKSREALLYDEIHALRCTLETIKAENEELKSRQWGGGGLVKGKNVEEEFKEEEYEEDDDDAYVTSGIAAARGTDLSTDADLKYEDALLGIENARRTQLGIQSWLEQQLDSTASGRRAGAALEDGSNSQQDIGGDSPSRNLLQLDDEDAFDSEPSRSTHAHTHAVSVKPPTPPRATAERKATLSSMCAREQPTSQRPKSKASLSKASASSSSSSSSSLRSSKGFGSAGAKAHAQQVKTTAARASAPAPAPAKAKAKGKPNLADFKRHHEALMVAQRSRFNDREEDRRRIRELARNQIHTSIESTLNTGLGAQLSASARPRRKSTTATATAAAASGSASVRSSRSAASAGRVSRGTTRTGVSASAAAAVRSARPPRSQSSGNSLPLSRSKSTTNLHLGRSADGRIAAGGKPSTVAASSRRKKTGTATGGSVGSRGSRSRPSKAAASKRRPASLSLNLSTSFTDGEEEAALAASASARALRTGFTVIPGGPFDELENLVAGHQLPSNRKAVAELNANLLNSIPRGGTAAAAGALAATLEQARRSLEWTATARRSVSSLGSVRSSLQSRESFLPTSDGSRASSRASRRSAGSRRSAASGGSESFRESDGGSVGSGSARKPFVVATAQPQRRKVRKAAKAPDFVERLAPSGSSMIGASKIREPRTSGNGNAATAPVFLSYAAATPVCTPGTLSGEVPTIKTLARTGTVVKKAVIKSHL